MKSKFVILTGSDGSGKSTIAERLSIATGYEKFHFGPPKDYEDGKKMYYDFIRNNVGKNVLTDRFHEGERIYAPLYRGYTADYFRDLEMTLEAHYNPLLVLVYAPFDVILDRISKRGEDFVKPEHIEYCYKAMIDEFNDSTLPKMIIDTSISNEYDNVTSILNKMYL